jgi:cytochrome P450
VFDDPDVIKLDRGCTAHLSFGGGRHYCLGAHRARSEFHVALAALVDRLPTLRLAVDETTLRFTAGSEFRVLTALPVTWSAS